MPKHGKAEKLSNDKGRILADPEIRKKFKSSLSTTTAYFRQIDDLKDSVKDAIADLSAEYGLDKKTIRKLAVTMYKSNYGSLLEENRHFETLYETVIEGKLRDPDDVGSSDPLDKAN